MKFDFLDRLFEGLEKDKKEGRRFEKTTVLG